MRYATVTQGIVSNVVVGEGLPPPFIPCGDAVAPGWSFDGSSFSQPAASRAWTAYEFLNRFTASERAEVRLRSATDPLLADFLMLATAAQEVVSDDPVTVNAMDYLVALGILTPSRRTEILADP
jgi:hypothetical protein